MHIYVSYEKPTSSNQVIYRDSVIQENRRMSNLNQEVNMRMLNTCALLDGPERWIILDDFCQKLCNSKFRMDQVRKVVVGGLIRYEQKLAVSLDRSKSGWKPLHESAESVAAACHSLDVNDRHHD